ncbi:MAG: Ig-like domain-containing protein [Lachnospiraceae bacterium]|nr:Ig-like domain-containing protein [Lachnospiraceae bacterium]
MKRIAKTAVLGLAMALSLSFGAGVTANAAKKVKVKKVVSVDSLTGKKAITLAKGKKATLTTTVTVTPNKNANKKVVYKTSNKKIATVTKKGVIKAKKAGKATITVASKKNSKKKAKVKVTVVKGKVTKVSVDKASVELKKAETATVVASVKASKGATKASKKLLWTSSNEKVATVTQSGVITAVAPGTAKITVISTDGTKKKATVDVKVVTTTLALGKKDVTAEITLTDAAKMKDDFAKLVGALGLKDTDAVELTIGDAKTATKKTVAEAKKFFADNKKKDVTVKVTVANAQAAKLGVAGTLFTPASVKSVKVGEVTFTEIKADSFKVGTTTYTYTADGKNVVVDGHVAKDFEKLTKAELITATEN